VQETEVAPAQRGAHRHGHPFVHLERLVVGQEQEAGRQHEPEARIDAGAVARVERDDGEQHHAEQRHGHREEGRDIGFGVDVEQRHQAHDVIVAEAEAGHQADRVGAQQADDDGAQDVGEGARAAAEAVGF
jgi:hypothetical protein